VTGTGQWIDPGPALISWEVTQNPDNTWHYSYTFEHIAGETSHFILEVSDVFTLDDLWNPTGDFTSVELGPFGPGPSNPGMPGEMNAIKFDGARGLITHISFDSPREPVWGDFYSKNGRVGGVDNAAWNAGFTEPDVDPVAPASDGSVENHVLVPDSEIAVPVETSSWGKIRMLYR
jgi:hypothetical protein